MRAGLFPRCRDIGGRSVWIEAEVNDWMLSRPMRPLKGDEGAGIPHRPYNFDNPRNSRKRIGVAR
jgi:hypothetical protein